jgi:GSH-dependent disulfide-bond oxidoreductase
MFSLTDSPPDLSKNQPAGYAPPTVWKWDSENGGQFANINRPVSGATHDKVLEIGKHPFQLYSMGTPNGVKVTIMLEELLALGHTGAEYDAWMISIGAGDQFSSGFVAINPNSKIPAMVDYSVSPPIRLFESGSMLFYLAEKFGEFLPNDPHKRAETMNWLMWQMASAPYVGGGLGHFYAYAPFKMEYPINRFAMETKRQLHVLDTHLATNEYMIGSDYTIADMAIWPWYGSIMREAYNCQEFLSVHEYEHLDRWVTQVGSRPAVKRGRMVNRPFGQPETRLRERHAASDFDTNRDDMVEARGGERV